MIFERKDKSRQEKIDSLRVNTILPLSQGAPGVVIEEAEIRKLGKEYTHHHSEKIKDAFRTVNPTLFHFITEYDGPMRKNRGVEKDYRAGNLIMYRVMQEEALKRNGIPPLVKDKAIDGYLSEFYGRDRYEKIKHLEKKRKQIDSFKLHREVHFDSRRSFLSEFYQNEPDLTSTLRRFTREQKCRNEFFFYGVMDVYFPFKYQQELTTFKNLLGR